MSSATLTRRARSAAATTVIAGVAFGAMAPIASAEMVNLTSPYGYMSESGAFNTLSGYDKPAGMNGDSSIAFCVEMGPYFPSSTTPVVKQVQTDEYPEIAYVINKWGEDRGALNQAAVQLLVHTHLDVYDPAFTSRHGIGPSDPSGSAAEYQRARQQMLNAVDPEVRNLADQYWAEASQSSGPYTATTPSIQIEGMGGTVTGIDITGGQGSLAASIPVTVTLAGDAVFTANGQQSITMSLGEARDGVPITATRAGGSVSATTSSNAIPSAELVIAEMGAHDGGDGYDGTGIYPEGHYYEGNRKTNRTGRATQTTISSVQTDAEVRSRSSVRGEFENPTAATEALDAHDGDKNAMQSGGVITDTLKYTGLIPGTEYRLNGTLMDKATGESTGVTATTTFTPEASSGSVELDFQLPSDNSLAGMDVVVFERVLDTDGNLVVAHEDIEDEAQTVRVRETAMGTLAVDAADGDKYLTQTGGVVNDTIYYEDVEPGLEYTIRGWLMDKATGEPLLDDEGNRVEGSETFVAEEESGELDIAFTLPDGAAGKTLVAFEEMLLDGVIIGEHKDIEDEAQTVYVLDFGTRMGGTEDPGADARQFLPQSGGMKSDLIEYENLEPGAEFIAKGELIDRETGESTGITSEIVFTADENGNGEVELPFDVPGDYAGDQLVAFVALYDGDQRIAEDFDLENDWETIYIADIGTTAFDAEDGDDFLVQQGATVTDTVEYTNLVPGQEYTLQGELMDQETGESTGLTAEKTFVAEERDGSVDVTFEDLPLDVQGKTLVAFEGLYDAEGELIAEHKDIEDEAQTVYVMGIETTATDKADDDKSIAWQGGTVVDTVDYSNLLVGQEYTMKGWLMDKETNEPLEDEKGNLITSETTFTPEEKDGVVALEFDLPDHAEGKTLVAFEELYDAEGELVAEHKDIEDEAQTVYVSEIRTKAYDQADGDKQVTHNGTVVDDVMYKNLIPGREYVVEGILMDQVSGDPILDDETGEEIIERVTFTPEESNGTVQVVFDLNRVSDRDVVVFETLYDADGKIQAVHHDINDRAQSFHTDEYVPPVEDPGTGTGSGSGMASAAGAAAATGGAAAGTSAGLLAGLLALMGLGGLGMRRRINSGKN